MEVINERCCGLDVHKKRVVACVVTPEGQETHTFSAMTQGLLGLADWLVEGQITHVAMESSGVFWKPVYNLLEGLDLTLLVVNARHIKAVPGARLTSRMRSGLLTWCATGCCGAATFQGDRSENCGSWCAIGEAWSASTPR
jgi:hypothetical protein